MTMPLRAMTLTNRIIGRCLRPQVRLARAGLSTSPDYHTYETWHHNSYETIDGPVNGLSSIRPIGQNFTDENPTMQQLAEDPRTSVLMELTDRVGALHDVLKYL